MKKYIILISAVLITLTTFKAKAQEKSYWGVFGGVSVPTGQFANSDYGTFLHDNNKAGFAKTGMTLGLDGAWYVHKNWAIAATVSYQDQGQLSANDAHTLAAGYQDAFGVDQGAVTSTKRYQNLNVLVGPQYSFFFSKFAVDLRANVGLIKSFSTPQINIVITDAGISYPFAQESSKASAFAYGGSADLRYNFTKKLGLVLKENYVASSGIDITNTQRVNNAGRLDTKQPITILQTTLGLNFSF
ncbi:outer membrane protein with beta-barrel domain [Mucilaginibacter frigoritolerans]|uniref:Outer membrane protein with beta-barrel domain n=1 Tax=Mucilaginibacter frigoritolerans TaxID=652788 RepID=A0A562UC60_9SPHI|nr:outer membrane beta-barrel protein [Mucilaginibacter frigoritolerans]TWJ03368.1 outer membrane protein with beta-barrel domain [Mucilaginibacter frigoritolerans]